MSLQHPTSLTSSPSSHSSSLCSGHASFLAPQTCQKPSHFRASASSVISFWSILPPRYLPGSHTDLLQGPAQMPPPQSSLPWCFYLKQQIFTLSLLYLDSETLTHLTFQRSMYQHQTYLCFVFIVCLLPSVLHEGRNVFWLIHSHMPGLQNSALYMELLYECSWLNDALRPQADPTVVCPFPWNNSDV